MHFEVGWLITIRVEGAKTALAEVLTIDPQKEELHVKVWSKHAKRWWREETIPYSKVRGLATLADKRVQAIFKEKYREGYEDGV